MVGGKQEIYRAITMQSELKRYRTPKEANYAQSGGVGFGKLACAGRECG